MKFSIYTPDAIVSAMHLADDHSRIMLVVRPHLYDSAAITLTREEASALADNLELMSAWMDSRPRSRWMRVKLVARRLFSWVK